MEKIDKPLKLEFRVHGQPYRDLGHVEFGKGRGGRGPVLHDRAATRLGPMRVREVFWYAPQHANVLLEAYNG